jgi:hypothetical protein
MDSIEIRVRRRDQGHELLEQKDAGHDELATTVGQGAFRTRIEAIRLVSMGWQFMDVANALDGVRAWGPPLVKRFNESGLDGLDDRRVSNVGRPALLDEEGMIALRAALAGRAPDGGLWTGPKVRAVDSVQRFEQSVDLPNGAPIDRAA